MANINVRVEDEFHRKLKVLAAKQGVSFQQLVIDALKPLVTKR